MLEITQDLVDDIHAHLESAHPEEGAGFLLGSADAARRVVTAILALPNSGADVARHNRYLLTPQDMLRAEDEAERLGLDMIGVFHSHPDCPNVPSEFDREWAMPWFSYIITRVDAGRAVSSRSWRLSDDREKFAEEEIIIR
ncbi:MAG: M67 family metallopeptidase [Anaerolineae bacterium]|nr:M67 family metallopeptidase [Anaerolineae bacterium]MBL6966608.1 M67 family metallopeptidase [Anaerolineales bacterium]